MTAKQKFQDILERLVQPHVLSLIALGIYQILKHYGYAFDLGSFNEVVDLITFVLFGKVMKDSQEGKLF